MGGAVSKARLALGAIGVTATAVAAAGLRGFYRRFPYASGESEIIHARTGDGWFVSMYRYTGREPKKPYPVVASHGFAGSHAIYDLGEVSLARYLAEYGYDVYAIDLRGRGESWPPGGSRPDLRWDFDDFVTEDLPAAVTQACQTSHASQCFWLGMEMSGQALYAACIAGTAGGIRGAVTFGAPAVTPPNARVPGVTAAPRGRSGGRVRFRAGAHHAGPLLALLRSSQLESSFRPANTDPLISARYLRSGVPDEAETLADQFADWVRSQTMRDAEGKVVYSDRLGEIGLPILLMAGGHDLQRPPQAIRDTFEAIGSDDKTFVLAGEGRGFSFDFGHDDLLAGSRGPAEVFPVVREWLDEHC